mmetsp:Transcript_105005/g.185993  ORF Transcript_105005/g.185993 Transcript_105005/m.185993 type:complete len:493 (+) Transcript_105005:34-1512(+)
MELSPVERYKYIICGFGPAGCGVTLAAARQGEFDNMCKEGLCILDSSERWGFGKLGEYLITANSPAGICIGPINPETPNFGFQAVQPATTRSGNIMTPLFEKMRSGDVYDTLLKTHHENPSQKGTLGQYGLYCEEIANVMTCALSGKSKACIKTRLKKMQLLSDGSFQLTAATDSGHTKTIISEKVCLALGGKPRFPEWGYGKDSCYSADFIQRTEGMNLMRQRAREVMASGAETLNVMVVGASHSAFSTTQLLLNALGHPLRVEMYHRGDIRVFCKSEEEAKRMGYSDYTQSQVCQKSGQVNRFGGIRSPVRELYADVRAGRETRLQFIQVSNEEMTGEPSGVFAEGIKKADVLIVAMGYETNTVPFLSPTGVNLEWAISPRDGQVQMDNCTAQPFVHLHGLDKAPKTLPNLFALGLGYGLTVGGAMKIGEEDVRIDGLGGYHSWVGDLVFRGMRTTESTPAWKFTSLDTALIVVYLAAKWQRRIRHASKI